MHDEMAPEAAPLAPEDAEIVGVDMVVQQAAVDGAEIQGNLVLLLFLLCGIGMVDAKTTEPLGMDEYNNVTEQETNKKEITKLAKMMRKITRLLTVQGLWPVVAESAEVNEQCPSVNFDAVERQEHFGMWLVIFILLVLWFLFAYMAWFAWRKMQENLNTYAQKLDKAEWDIHYCWTQVADEDNYIAQQAARIDGLHNQFMMIDGRLTEASNEERANLVAFNAMGAGQYLNLVRQRAYVEGGETTDVQMSGNQNTEETEESENATGDEVTAARLLQDPSMTDLMEELKIEFRLAQQRNEPNDAVRIQRIMMQMLNNIRNGVTNETVENYSRRIADLLFQMSETARSQNRLQSSLYYGRRCAHFRGDA
ncbi:unnamed protein product [Cladocopium goreaui]|uniref:Uncharacterized protein n=1 Tax=Cladocopium goreaui TaxID=2562237 RepID=A0A9P1BJ59_9DINO|nr:unnamed protein product [Cladocopium goreaui]